MIIYTEEEYMARLAANLLPDESCRIRCTDHGKVFDPMAGVCLRCWRRADEIEQMIRAHYAAKEQA